MNRDHQPAAARRELGAVRRVVVKLGTRVLTGPQTEPGDKLADLAQTLAALPGAGREVLIVSSGAVGLGSKLLGFDSVPTELGERQACAAIGQTRLMALYEQAFARHGRRCAQVLLTQDDFADRVRYLNLRTTLTTLLRHGVVPVINENDAVSTEELAYSESSPQRVFGDNDKLSALVAAKLDAGLLVLLTDVRGVYDRDPGGGDGARLITEIDDLDAIDTEGRKRGPGRGGMASKLEAASIAARAGCHAVIASGIEPGVLQKVLDGDAEGTWVRASGRLTARRRWIAFAVAPRGTLYLDEGCVRAVRERGASVLAAGVTRCDGDFAKGDVVQLADAAGHVFGRGIVFCNAATTRAWSGGARPQGVRNHDALVHRDHLVLEDP